MSVAGQLALNVLGGPLQECGTDPMTGFYRDGCCGTGPQDVGSHTVCAVVTAEFLAHQQRVGNDLSTPRPEYSFPGLQPGDRWCVVAIRWMQAYLDGVAAPVVLASTHERALDVGILRTVWMTQKELFASQERHRSPLVMQCVDDYLQGKRAPLSLLFTHPSALGV